jgi:hypothetical protein
MVERVRPAVPARASIALHGSEGSVGDQQATRTCTRLWVCVSLCVGVCVRASERAHMRVCNRVGARAGGMGRREGAGETCKRVPGSHAAGGGRAQGPGRSLPPATAMHARATLLPQARLATMRAAPLRRLLRRGADAAAGAGGVFSADARRRALVSAGGGCAQGAASRGGSPPGAPGSGSPSQGSGSPYPR